MTWLTLKSQTWFALEMWGGYDGQAPHVSPIRIRAVTPMKTGKGQLKVAFFHANYPEGVQDKEYTLRVLHRNAHALVALREDDDRDSILIFFPLTKEWLQIHFPDCLRNASEEPINRVLDRSWNFKK